MQEPGPRGNSDAAPGDPFARDVIALFGLPFDLPGLGRTADRVTAAAKSCERLFLSTVNLDWIVQSRKDPAFRQSALVSDHVTMDGVPVVKLAQLAGCARAEKAAGSDLFEVLRGQELSVFFFGGREGAAEAAHRAIEAAGGPMRAAGWHDPGFGDVASMSDPETIAAINGSGADLLIVALGAKKGQAWIMANADRLAPPVVTHLGAVVDFTAGTVARAPRALQVAGFEWAWRIGQDPALWSRYADDFKTLPGLMRQAVAVRREIADRRKAAPGPTAALDRDAGGATLSLSGRLGADDLRAPLRQAFADGGPLTIDLQAAAAPDLETLGQLLLSRALWTRACRRHTLCTQDERMADLAAWTLGGPGASSAGL